MNLSNIYKTLLLEGSVDGCVKLFGNELFGDELGGSEKNTPIENRYKDEIVDFTDNMYGEEITPAFFDMIKNLKACINKYPEVLIPEDEPIFRGTMIPISYFINNKQQINIDGNNDYLYRGYSKIQSWTTDHSVANSFGDNEMINSLSKGIDLNQYITSEGRIGLLNDMIKRDLRLSFRLHYHSNENDFLFKAKYFSRLSHNSDESEILRINNTPIMVSAYLKSLTHKINQSGVNLIKLINIGISEL